MVKPTNYLDDDVIYPVLIANNQCRYHRIDGDCVDHVIGGTPWVRSCISPCDWPVVLKFSQNAHKIVC